MLDKPLGAEDVTLAMPAVFALVKKEEEKREARAADWATDPAFPEAATRSDAGLVAPKEAKTDAEMPAWTAAVPPLETPDVLPMGSAEEAPILMDVATGELIGKVPDRADLIRSAAFSATP